MFILTLYVTASVFFILNDSIEHIIPKDKLIEYIENIGYYLSYISIVYTFALEIQSCFYQYFEKIEKKSFGNKFRGNLKDIDLLFFLCSY